ncbi:MAG: hypothetical protein M5U09_28230, partial [Gammaproteobacteria bacterium]|nr:hypothetical protein [Gammaproteobacteria bacterium]
MKSRYLHLVLISSQFTAWSVLEADRVAMPKVNRETFSDLRLPLRPPPSRRLSQPSSNTNREDRRDGRQGQAAIERLQEYRTALITATVTGRSTCRKVQWIVLRLLIVANV